jgi:pimeloyl-ACP methyl ester carboxylesterase
LARAPTAIKQGVGRHGVHYQNQRKPAQHHPTRRPYARYRRTDGDDDRILPADATSKRQAKMIKNVKYVEIKGGSHGMPWTRAAEINAELVRFLA